MNNTKEKILEVALNLFSQNGFSAVSIRDICKVVQIKESSIYYHFQNKQAIFDELMIKFENEAMKMMKKLEDSFCDNIDFSGSSFKNVCEIYFEQYLMDDFCNRILRLLSIEQLDNSEIQKKYEFWVFEKPLSFQKNIFMKLIKLKIINNTDSEYLAIKYYSPIYYYTQRWLLSGELSDYKKEMFSLNVYKHIQNFFDELNIQKVI